MTVNFKSTQQKKEIKELGSSRLFSDRSITLLELKNILVTNPTARGVKIMQLVQEQILSDSITIRNACSEYQLADSTIATWLKLGHIKSQQVIPNPKGNGRPVHLISKTELESFLKIKPKRGRPKKNRI